ncbi:MAG: TA system VapC family ribonuclease toxin [Terriglobales bacterium]
MAYLLDVNVLVALSWPPHEGHAAAQKWFQKHRAEGWVSCPITQAGLVRLLANPAVTGDSAGMEAAQLMLRTAVEQPEHRFIADDLAMATALEAVPVVLYGHRQVTDAYLLALAMAHELRLATLDRGLIAWLPRSGPVRAAVELIA